MKLDVLKTAVREAAAIRRIRKLQPVGGRGDKIYPPTYPGAGKNDPARHVFEYRRQNDTNVLCVLIDSVQSQANRLEEALKVARLEGSGTVKFPVVAVDFSGTDVGDLGQITSLDAPHRIFDAIIRDSAAGTDKFGDTPEGRKLVSATTRNVRAVYDLSPTTLVFGAWNSTGEGGGLGAKFPRVIVSEVIGVGVATEPASTEERPAASGARTGSRIDPLGIRSAVAVYRQPNGDWTLKPTKTKGEKEVRPSEVNHSNIAPSVIPLGVSVDYALHTFVLSFSALRRLGFEGLSPDATNAAQAALAAIGVTAITALDRTGYFLRSRCEFVAEEDSSADFELIMPSGRRESVSIGFEDAADLLQEASAMAAKLGIPWRVKDLVLKPQEKLVGLVRQSREKALQGEAEKGEE